MDNQETFHYTYSAQQREEIDAIRKKYLPQEEQADKMEQLRRLDASTTRKGMLWGLICGILGSLSLGAGMSLIMTDLGASLTGSLALTLGIVLGTLGIAGVVAAYPMYQYFTTQERKRLAPQILKLTEELMQ